MNGQTALAEKLAHPIEENVSRLLIVEDEPSIQQLIRLILKKGSYTCDAVGCAEDARRVMAHREFDMVLLDIGLPGESGLDFVRWMKSAYPDIGAIMITGHEDMETAETALAYGAYSYVIKPFKPNDLLIRISSDLKRRKVEMKTREITGNMARQIAYKTHELETLEARMNKAMNGIITAMSMALESRDPYTAGHQHRVSEISVAIGSEMGLEEEQIHAMYMASMVHDIGKISIPSEILSKPGKLNDLEFKLIQTHSEVGYNILKEIDFPWPIADIVHQHHERIDGSGYPQGLKGHQLLLESKILTVADVVEAMASHRPYRPSLGVEVALQQVCEKKGNFYDERVVDACLKVFREKKVEYTI